MATDSQDAPRLQSEWFTVLRVAGEYIKKGIVCQGDFVGWFCRRI